MPQDSDTLIRQAKVVLDFNWTGEYTQPGPRLYLHQWSWDSVLIAMGYAHYDQERAIKEGQMKELLSEIPVGRMGKPEEVATLVVYLASDASAYVTGSTFFIDGGMMSRTESL